MHKNLIIGGTQIRTNDDGLVSLTDIYAAAEREGIADRKRIERFDVRGNAPCATECHRAALSVAQIQ